MSTLFFVKPLAGHGFLDDSHNREFLSILQHQVDEQSSLPQISDKDQTRQTKSVHIDDTARGHQATDCRILSFTTNHFPKNPSVGFVFGSDPKKCDVLLTRNKDPSIRSRQFSISFDAQPGTLLLKNLTFTGTGIVDSSKRISEEFNSIPLGDKAIEVALGSLSLIVAKDIAPNAGDVYKSYWSRLRNALPSLAQLEVCTGTGAVTKAQPAGQSVEGEWEKCEELGKGAMGTVFRGRHRKTSEVVAIKCFTKGSETDYAWRECQKLVGLSHEHVIGFREFHVKKGEDPWLIMEHAAEGDLITANTAEHFSGFQFRTVLLQTLRGLQYLHGKDIIHGDIKPANILVTSRKPLHIKLADFSHSKVATDRHGFPAGTRPYMAPEVWGRRYSTKVDIWSVGIMALELLDTLPKYTKTSGYSATWFRTIDEKKSETANKLLADFLAKTLSEDVASRYNAGRCLDLNLLREPFSDQPWSIVPATDDEDEDDAGTGGRLSGGSPEDSTLRVPDVTHDELTQEPEEPQPQSLSLGDSSARDSTSQSQAPVSQTSQKMSAAHPRPEMESTPQAKRQKREH